MIELNWTLLLQFANFVILLAILNVVCYRPFRELLARRRETIEGGHQKARDLESQINEKMASYQERLTEAKHKANAEKAVLRQEGLKQESEILSSAREEAAGVVASIRGRVTEEAAKARQQLKVEAEGLAGKIASTVLGRNM